LLIQIQLGTRYSFGVIHPTKIVINIHTSSQTFTRYFGFYGYWACISYLWCSILCPGRGAFLA